MRPVNINLQHGDKEHSCLFCTDLLYLALLQEQEANELQPFR